MPPRKRRAFSKGQIARYWIDWEIEHKTTPPWSSHGWDWEEPACMAGGWWKPGWDRPNTITTMWNKTSLQRCHIVPLFKGGPDELGNLVLMCENCHAQQPDSIEPEVTYAYMRARTLWDCLGIAGAVASGLLAVANGTNPNTATEDTLRQVKAAVGL